MDLVSMEERNDEYFLEPIKRTRRLIEASACTTKVLYNKLVKVSSLSGSLRTPPSWGGVRLYSERLRCEANVSTKV